MAYVIAVRQIPIQFFELGSSIYWWPYYSDIAVFMVSDMGQQWTITTIKLSGDGGFESSISLCLLNSKNRHRKYKQLTHQQNANEQLYMAFSLGSSNLSSNPLSLRWGMMKDSQAKLDTVKSLYIVLIKG